jgi:hypothetical protein
MEQGKTNHIDSRTQIILLVVVVVIGIGGTALGALNVRSNILNPFKYSGPENETAFSNTLGAVSGSTVDTDGDGLSDSEELNNYDTSPYLSDSDSDGISDYDEVTVGSDPNCPQGQPCSVENREVDPNANVPLFDDAPATSGVEQPTVEELRATLIQSGLPADQVNALTDQEIMQAYYGALGQSNLSGSANISEYANLSPGQIRELLVSQGIDISLLENLSDEELVSLYQSSLESVQ